MRKIPISELKAFFRAVSRSYKLFIPTDQENGAVFSEWNENVELSKRQSTVKSAKDFFFPQAEGLMSFRVEGKTLSVAAESTECENFVLFGVRACDEKSFHVLDRVFLSQPVDSYYKSRRENCTIITLACNKPKETCFCKTFGIDPAEPHGDITAWENGNCYIFKANTEKGEGLLALTQELTEECSENAADEVKTLINERMSKLPLADLKADAFGKGKTDKYFDAPEWKELSEACLGCGTCTFVCPTCQCYDIKDVSEGRTIKRYRCWDSCMYSEFTKMSAGQPRTTQTQRFRQRFMHKLVYFPDNNDGMFSCVGCGRCVSRCPVNMNIVKVMKKLGGKENE